MKKNAVYLFEIINNSVTQMEYSHQITIILSFISNIARLKFSCSLNRSVKHLPDGLFFSKFAPLINVTVYDPKNE